MEQRNKSIYSLVFQLHASDNEIHIREFKYLNDLANSLGLNRETVEEIIADPMSFELTPPPPEQERMEILYYLLFAMQIDGVVTTSEELIVQKLGVKLGFLPVMVTEMIQVLKNHLTTRVPDGVLVDIIKKYLN